MVSFALCDGAGAPLGTTPEARMPRAPGWSDTRPLVALAAAEWGVAITVLRLVDASKVDGVRHLRYAAEVAASPSVPLEPARPADFADEPLRQRWAQPGGPARQLEWAERELALAGKPVSGAPQQVRSWNLSSLWRIPHAGGVAWLKAVPAFFAHEGEVIERLRGFDVPRLVARGDAVLLLDDIPGEDLYGASVELAVAMVDLLVGIQHAVAAHEGWSRRLPDWRLPAVADGAAHTLERAAAVLTPGERETVSRIIDGFDARSRELAACGIPDTLVHGDFHPGNVRGTAERMTLLDWGDSGWGHPLLDVAAFTERMGEADAAAVVDHWLSAWRSAIPGSDPARALAVIGPVAALRQAVIYQGFLDRIEPDERIYHAEDPAIWLRKTALLAEQGAAPD